VTAGSARSGPLLVVDTATRRAVIALGRLDGALVAERSWVAGYRHGEELLARIDALLRDEGVAPGALGGLVVGIGPGAFTGLRVGIATVKGLAYALGLPIVGVATGEALLAAAGTAAAGTAAGTADTVAGGIAVAGTTAAGTAAATAAAGAAAAAAGAGTADTGTAGTTAAGTAAATAAAGAGAGTADTSSGRTADTGAGGGPVDLVLLQPAGPADAVLSRPGERPRIVPGGTDPGLRPDERLVAVDLDGRADEPAAELGLAALGGLAAALLRTGAARLAAGDPDDLVTLVPEYVTLPRGVREAVPEALVEVTGGGEGGGRGEPEMIRGSGT
jgi:tRNA threonylcarbamoyl adenosine modification protein YeaZ